MRRRAASAPRRARRARRRHGRGRPRRTAAARRRSRARIAATPSAWASTPSPVGSSRPATSGAAKARARATVVAAARPVLAADRAGERSAPALGRRADAVVTVRPARPLTRLHGKQELPHDRDLVGSDERRRVADAGELVQRAPSGRARAIAAAVAGARTSESAPRSSSVGQRIASYAAQSAASPAAAISARDGAQRHADRRVVVQAEAIAVAAQHRPRQRHPFARALCGPKPLRDRQQVVGGLVLARPGERLAEVGADARQAGRVDRRADVVERPGAQIGEPGSAARPMPIRPPIEVPNQCDAVRVEAGEQRHHVGDVARQRVAHRVGEPIGFAAADDVGADDAEPPASPARATSKSRPWRDTPCDADQHALGRAALAPFPVGHAVQAARVQALDMASRGSVDGCSRSSFHLHRAADVRR